MRIKYKPREAGCFGAHLFPLTSLSAVDGGSYCSFGMPQTTVGCCGCCEKNCSSFNRAIEPGGLPQKPCG